MTYSEKILERFENPKHVGSMDKTDLNVGTGLAGSVSCGDILKLQLKINPETKIIENAVWKTFGCASAMASSEYVCEIIKNMHIKDAENIQNKQIVDELFLPPVKVHCSVLAEDAIKAALKDWKNKQNVSQ